MPQQPMVRKKKKARDSRRLAVWREKQVLEQQATEKATQKAVPAEKAAAAKKPASAKKPEKQ